MRSSFSTILLLYHVLSIWNFLILTCTIYILAPEYGIRGKETVAHEMGHVLGLAHRISDKTSLMYFEGAPSGIVSPRDLDQRVLNHTYGY